MWSTVNLQDSDKARRKIDNEPSEWSDKDFNLMENVNKFHYSPATFTYRNGNSIIKGAKWILIDVDEPNDNVEEKLLEYKLEYIKAPSASASNEVTYKWHYFVKTKRLSSDADIARAQINDFYTALGLVNIDPTSIDPVRYFAPCGCAEVLGSDAWKKRIKWCNKRTKIVKGNQWVPIENINPISTIRGIPAYISELVNVGAPEFDSEGDYKIKVIKHNKNSYKLDPQNKIYTKNGWTTLDEIASKLKVGESVSNLFGCPIHNMDHTEPKTIGYGYAHKTKHVTYFNCGGNSCKGNTYYIVNKENK